MRNFAWRAAAIGGVAAFAVGSFSGSAVAHDVPEALGVTYVDGFEVYTDDWQDHEREMGVLSEGSGPNDTVLLWQSVLAADGYLTTDELTETGGTYDADTVRATRHWQIDNDLDADGLVGMDTWSVADDNLRFTGGELRYTHPDHDGYVSFERADDDSGAYTYLGITTDSGDSLTNDSGSPRIQHYNLTISLS